VDVPVYPDVEIRAGSERRLERAARRGIEHGASEGERGESHWRITEIEKPGSRDAER
jgi:hypothetical protein